ncbi:hypothetical protein ZTR_10708 [Talaromyces verruculosus]|nr:hypothetical protein ZTR_10708 [Talaromyces verruculosus]
MGVVKTPMSISALLNPQQRNADINTRQHLDLRLRRMQMDDGKGIYYKQSDHRQQVSKRIHYDNTEGLRLRINSDNSYKNQLEEGLGGYCYKPFNSTIMYKRHRAHRPRYTDEEMYFIWYHRVDLDKEWRDCTEDFNKQFPGQGHSERNRQGLQCKFYRFIDAKKCPTLRGRQQLQGKEFIGRGYSTRERLLPKFGVVEWCHVWYPWMRAEHAVAGLHPGPQLHQKASSNDKQKMKTYTQSSVSSTASILSSEALTPKPDTPSSYSDDIASKEEMVA